MFALTDTWRASQDRIDSSTFAEKPVNDDNAKFLLSIIRSFGASAKPMFLGGQIGPKGDAYKPEEAPDRHSAKAFHRPQLQGLAKGGVDFLYAATLASPEEAIGIAEAMAETGPPYVLSFVVRAHGPILDGLHLDDTMRQIDGTKPYPPAGYASNCVYPTVLMG